MNSSVTQAMRANELLPCPFCGSLPVVRRCMEEYPQEGESPSGEYELGVIISCTSCGIEVEQEYRSQCIEAWNKRAAPPVIPAVTADDGVIDAMAQAMMAVSDRDGVPVVWRREPEIVREAYRKLARAALTAGVRGNDNG